MATDGNVANDITTTMDKVACELSRTACMGEGQNRAANKNATQRRVATSPGSGGVRRTRADVQQKRTVFARTGKYGIPAVLACREGMMEIRTKLWQYSNRSARHMPMNAPHGPARETGPAQHDSRPPFGMGSTHSKALLK